MIIYRKKTKKIVVELVNVQMIKYGVMLYLFLTSHIALQKFLDKRNMLVKVMMYSITLTGLLFFICCTVTSQNLHAIKLVVNYPLVQLGESKVFNLPDTIPIFYFDDYVLYNIPYRITFENSDSLISEGKKFSYFMFRKKDKYGFLFDSLKLNSRTNKVNVDSFLFQRCYLTNFDSGYDSLIENKSDKKDHTALKKYIPKKYYGESYYDSSYYYYSEEFNDIDYILSKQLDKRDGMKLYRVRLLYNEKVSIKYNFTLPKRELLYEIEKYAISDYEEILDFFKQFQKEYGSLKK
jgi:hypothetical protein